MCSRRPRLAHWGPWTSASCAGTLVQTPGTTRSIVSRIILMLPYALVTGTPVSADTCQIGAFKIHQSSNTDMYNASTTSHGAAQSIRIDSTTVLGHISICSLHSCRVPTLKKSAGSHSVGSVSSKSSVESYSRRLAGSDSTCKMQCGSPVLRIAAARWADLQTAKASLTCLADAVCQSLR